MTRTYNDTKGKEESLAQESKEAGIVRQEKGKRERLVNMSIVLDTLVSKFDCI